MKTHRCRFSLYPLACSVLFEANGNLIGGLERLMENVTAGVSWLRLNEA